MGKQIQEFSHFMTPDSLRQFNHLMLKLYQNHIPKSYGLEDFDGTQYSGTVENFGSELLLETSKLRLRKPPIKQLKIANNISFYFDIQYSEYIDTYAQQLMLCLVLKPNVILPNISYQIIFENIETEYIIRSESSSDPIVHCDTFLHTTTPPTLYIQDEQGNLETYQIDISDGTGITDFYFPMNDITQDMIHTFVDDVLTIDINEKQVVNLPYVWFCVPSFKRLPTLTMTGNEDVNGLPLLTIGNDGHGVARLYPYVQGSTNVPSSSVVDDCKWFLKVHGDFQQDIGYDGYISCQITEIEYLFGTAINEEPVERYSIEYDTSYSKIMLSENVAWHFRVPDVGDWDYDSTTYENPCHAWIELSDFIQNINHQNLMSAFRIAFDVQHFIDSYELMTNHVVSGMHVDFTTDYSDHSIYKNHGVIHDMGEFDGLPSYLNKWMDRDTHRGHIEVYSIRDNLVKNKPMKRQTSGIIIDTGVPQNELPDIINDLSVVIKYDGDGVYITDGRSESSTNYLTELGYINWNSFGNTTIPIYANKPKFIYHGNGVFSLNPIGFDPELEYGRVYAITNDSIAFDNNLISSDPKPSRTLARICDIPTSFIQLTNISGSAPTYVLDSLYVRQIASLSTEDLENLWNTKSPKIVSVMEDSYQKFIFGPNDNLNLILTANVLEASYSQWIQLNESLDMTMIDNDSTNPNRPFWFQVNNGGSGYNEGDKFSIIIGGLTFNGTIESVEAGVVTEISIISDDDAYVNQGNISSIESVYKTTTISGTGSGLTITLIISNDTWNTLHRMRGDLFNNLYALKIDGGYSIWIWKYIDGVWELYKQLTGEKISENLYDSLLVYPNQSKRSLEDVFLYRLLDTQFHTNTDSFTWENTNSHALSTTIDPATFDDTGETDYSEDISKFRNYEETFSYLTQSIPGVSNPLMQAYHRIINDYNQYPVHHIANTYIANNGSYKLIPVFESDEIQPDVYWYHPSKNVIHEMINVCDNLSLITNIHDQTFLDVLPNELIDNQTLLETIYSYSIQNDINALSAIRTELSAKTYEEILTNLENMFGDCDPVVRSTTPYPYTYSELLNYTMQRLYKDPVYKRSDTKLLRHKNDIVIEYDEQGTALPIGDQPVGGYEKISNERCDGYVTCNEITHSSNPSYVFKIDDMDITDLNNFKMHDSQGRDISQYCVLIINNVMYTYMNGWKKIYTHSS